MRALFEVVVLHAAIHALQGGYRVIVPVDTCGGSAESTNRAALEQIRDFGGVLSSVLSIAAALSPNFSADNGQQGFEIVQTLRLA